MPEPQFTHDCDNCKFVGIINGMDVFTCGNSILARYGNDGPDYASISIVMFKAMIKNNGSIEGTNDDGTRWQMPFQDYLASDKVIDYHKTWLIALALL
jgi:hypothetical protein